MDKGVSQAYRAAYCAHDHSTDANASFYSEREIVEGCLNILIGGVV